MLKTNIWQDPATGETLDYDKNSANLVSKSGKSAYKVNKIGIAEFLKESDISGSNEKSTQFYNSFSPFYELGQKCYYAFFGGEKKARNDYLQFLDIKAGDTVLEVSVGTAANIKYLPKDACYYGLDISKGQLAQSVRNRDKFQLPLTLCWGNAECLPFRDNRFDVVYHIGGINLFNDKKKAIAEMVRVAKPGTHIMISDETEKVAKKYEKLPYFGKPFKNRKEAIISPVGLLPDNIENVKSQEIRNGTLYVLTFDKKLHEEIFI